MRFAIGASTCLMVSRDSLWRGERIFCIVPRSKSHHYRESASLPATCVRFHGFDGEQVLLTSGDGTVRSFSVWRDTQQFNFGSARQPGTDVNRSFETLTFNLGVTISKVKKRQKNKLFGGTHNAAGFISPPVRLASDTTRELQWDNGATLVFFAPCN